MNQLVSLAVAEKLSSLLTEDYLNQRAQHPETLFEVSLKLGGG
jgi:hypothetical protein